MRKSHLLPSVAALLISGSVPVILTSCSEGGDNTGTGGTGAGAAGGSGGGSGTMSTGGQGAAGMASAGKPGTGGTGGGAGTGGSSGTGTSGGASATGGTGNAGASAGGKSGGGGTAGGMEGGAAGEDTGPTGGVSAGGKAGGAPGGGAGSGGASGSGGAGAFMLSSPNHAEGAKFDGKYTCDGGNLGQGVNPELDWTNVPAGTKSLAITFIDTTIGEDNMMGQHWAMWNIPWDANTGKVSQLPESTGMTLMGDLMGAKQSGKFLTPCAQSTASMTTDDEYELKIFALSEATLTFTGTSVASCLNALKAVTPLGTATLHGHSGYKGQ